MAVRTEAFNGGSPGVRLYIVEDDALIRLDLEEIAAGLGCDVVGTSTTWRAALEDVSALDIDVALVDLLLADGNAHPLIEELERLSVPVAICTGLVGKETTERYPHLPVLGKPFDAHQLDGVLKAALGGAYCRRGGDVASPTASPARLVAVPA